eukprot:1555694-Pyramimonas_sp.AAC.1
MQRSSEACDRPEHRVQASGSTSFPRRYGKKRPPRSFYYNTSRRARRPWGGDAHIASACWGDADATALLRSPPRLRK